MPNLRQCPNCSVPLAMARALGRDYKCPKCGRGYTLGPDRHGNAELRPHGPVALQFLLSVLLTPLLVIGGVWGMFSGVNEDLVIPVCLAAPVSIVAIPLLVFFVLTIRNRGVSGKTLLVSILVNFGVTVVAGWVFAKIAGGLALPMP